MVRQNITLPKSKASGLPSIPAVRAGDYIFTSGEVGNVDAEGNNVETIEGQTRQCWEYIKQTLEAAGSSLSDVVKVTNFLGDMRNFWKMNEVYYTYFPRDKDLPARSTLVISLDTPEGLSLGKPSRLIKIDCIAYCPSK